MDQIVLLFPKCCGAGEREEVEWFCAIMVGSPRLFAVVPTLHFEVRASSSSAEEQGVPYVQSVSIFVSCCRNIAVVQKALGRYDVTRAMINCKKLSILRLVA